MCAYVSHSKQVGSVLNKVLKTTREKLLSQAVGTQIKSYYTNSTYVKNNRVPTQVEKDKDLSIVKFFAIKPVIG